MRPPPPAAARHAAHHRPAPRKAAITLVGLASWFRHPAYRTATASGEIHFRHCHRAHRGLPFGTMSKVADSETAGHRCAIDDAAPFPPARHRRLRSGRRDLAMLDEGIGHFRLEILGGGTR